MVDGALVLPIVTLGMTLASVTRNFATPNSRGRGSIVSAGGQRDVADDAPEIREVLASYRAIPPMQQFLASKVKNTAPLAAGCAVPPRLWRGAALRSILPGMEAPGETPPIRVGAAPDGSLTYLVDLPPEALPPVTRRDLERAWYAARRAALAEQWGAVRVFRFPRDDGGHSDLVLADRDASCWAGALDAIYGIGTRQGLSLCLRLLALIDLLAQSPWAMPLVRLARDGAEPDPALLHAAATEPLTSEARFDQTAFRARLARYTSQRLTGASV
jgi:hypothetical protein